MSELLDDASQDQEIRDVNQKALTLNLDPHVYGTIAEIGAGQEVARNFFHVGATAGSVAKTMSAYDMTFSDSIYGSVQRYVSYERLVSMLDHEYDLLVSRLQESRGATTKFFAFADTVTTRSAEDGRESHGWMGVRFQQGANAPWSQVVIHIRMLDKARVQQHRALGRLGVNFLFAAYNYADDLDYFILSLFDDIEEDRIQIDAIECSGHLLDHVDNRQLSVQLVQNELADAIMLSPERTVVHPSEILYKRPVLVQRGNFRPITNVNIDMLSSAAKQFAAEREFDSDPVILLEISTENLLTSSEHNAADFLGLADTLAVLGYHVLISNYPEHFRLSAYLRRYTNAPIAFVLGVNSLVNIMNESYYADLEGGLLEAMGRLFKQDVRLYAYPVLRDTLMRYSATYKSKKIVLDIPGKIIFADSLEFIKPLHYFYQYLVQSKHIAPVENFDEGTLGVLNSDVCTMIKNNDHSWKEYVPEKAAEMIEKRNLFVND